MNVSCHAVFGKVISGMDVVKKIRYETTNNVPLELNELQVWVNNSNILNTFGISTTNTFILNGGSASVTDTKTSTQLILSSSSPDPPTDSMPYHFTFDNTNGTTVNNSGSHTGYTLTLTNTSALSTTSKLGTYSLNTSGNNSAYSSSGINSFNGSPYPLKPIAILTTSLK